MKHLIGASATEGVVRNTALISLSILPSWLYTPGAARGLGVAFGGSAG
jgi:hypothetical protein